ncbi:hypothetical protein IMZ48_12640 [Candidatus Bathyarchaeota archaeon]|nr:hypothetical protein [Candidatus Bathyarchaeota archaeon]
MATLTTGSVEVDFAADLQLLFEKELSGFKKFKQQHGVSFYNYLNNIARAAKALNGLIPGTSQLNDMDSAVTAGSGVVTKVSWSPWSSTVNHISGGTIASSSHLRLVIASSQLNSKASSIWYIPRTRFGLGKIKAVQAQITSTRGVWELTNQNRHPTLLVPAILSTNSTVIIRQYGSIGTTPGSCVVSTGSCNLTVFAWGY